MNSTLVYAIIGIVIGVIVAYPRVKKRQSFKREPEKLFPSKWRVILEEKVEFYNRLERSKKSDFEKRVHIFLLNVNIVGINTEVTHLDRILIASGAIIPIFGFDKWHYANLKVVELYPDKFHIPGRIEMANGLVGWGAMEGKMLLSRKSLIHGFYDPNDNKNVAIHEFIHVLDKQDGRIDGVLDKVMNEIDIQPWLQIINQKMSEISDNDSSIRKYGATNNAEFLAVVSEFFFESPERMKTEHPALYNALNSFYNGNSRTFF